MKETRNQSIFKPGAEIGYHHFFSATNLAGVLLVASGVFLCANKLVGRGLAIGNFRLSSAADAGMFFIALNLILFALAFIASKIIKKKS